MPAPDPYAAEKKTLAAAQWRRIKYAGSLNGHEAELVRQCISIPDGQQQSCLTYLDTVLSVNAPRAGKKTYPGLWRVVSNEGGVIKPVDGKPAQWGIIQTLKLGYAQTILTTGSALDFTEARLINMRRRLWASGEYNPQRKSVAMYWPNLDPAYLKAITDSVPTYLDSPTINGEAYDGPGHASLRWYRKDYNSCREEDGSGVVWAVFSTEPDAITMAVHADATEHSTRALTRVESRADANDILTSLVTQTTGKVISGSVAQSAEGAIAEVSTLNADLLDTGVLTIPDENGPAYYREVKNAASIAPYIPTTCVYGSYLYSTSISVHYNAFKLWDITWHQAPRKQWPDQYVNTTVSYDYTEWSSNGKHSRTVTVAVKYTTNMSAAYSFASGGIEGSHVSHNDALTRFVATKKTATAWDPAI